MKARKRARGSPARWYTVIATLVGSVADANEANFVATVAWRVDGIVSVTNQLQFDDQPLW